MYKFNPFTTKLDLIGKSSSSNIIDGTAIGQIASWSGSIWTPISTSDVFFDSVNKRWGFGTDTPGSILELRQATGTPKLRIVSDASHYAGIDFLVQDGNFGQFEVYKGNFNFNAKYEHRFLVNDGTRILTLKTSNKIGIGNIVDPTAKLHLPAGTATASTAPLKFTAGTLLTTPEVGAVEFSNGRLYITNLLKRKAIDRTSDVGLETVTVEDTTTETTLWTGAMSANSLSAGNIFKFHADGVIQNAGATASDEVTLRIKVGGVTVATLNPTTKAIPIGSHWHIDANATQRTIGTSGQRAVHIDLVIDDNEESVVAVATVDTTANMDVTVTAQWASADPDNIISKYQGYMEYKN